MAQPTTVHTPLLQNNIVHRSVQASGVSVTFNPIQFIAFKRATADIIFGLARAGRRVYVSWDAMLTWEPTNATNVIAIHPSPVNSAVAFFLGAGKTSYFTTDLGGQIESVRVNVNLLKGFVWHPKVFGWALGHVGGSIYDVYITKDSGATWTKIADKATQYSWCHAGTHTQNEHICVVDEHQQFKVSNDLGVTWRVVVKHVDYFLDHTKFLLLIGQDPILPIRKDLYVSRDHGESFENALLPTNINVPTLRKEQILDDRTGAIWIAVNHGDRSSGVPRPGDIYVSDADGIKFALAFKHCNSFNNWWDFAPILSLEGHYIVNYLTTWEDDITPGGETLLQTFITYDNGKEWRRLQAPEGSNTTGCERCHLNIFGVTTWLGVGGGFYGNFYSAPEAVGLVIGTGNVGDTLTIDESKINTYLSRDGGLSWDQIMKGPTIYEYGDHGGILVVAHNTVLTKTVYYSLDEGLTWTGFNFTDKPIKIINVFQFSASGKRMAIFGQVEDGTSAYWGLDFTNVHEKQCEESDYETWSARDGRNDGKCVLGHEITYKRRSRSADCYSDTATNHVVSIRNCSCIAEDFECDYGFEETLSGNCAVVDNSVVAVPSPCKAGTTYTVTSGFRRIPGDTCFFAKKNNTVTRFMPAVKSCPSHHRHFTTVQRVFMVLGVLLALVVFTCVGMVLGGRSEFVRRTCPWITKAPEWIQLPQGGTQLIDEEDDNFLVASGEETPDESESSPFD